MSSACRENAAETHSSDDESGPPSPYILPPPYTVRSTPSDASTSTSRGPTRGRGRNRGNSRTHHNTRRQTRRNQRNSTNSSTNRNAESSSNAPYIVVVVPPHGNPNQPSDSNNNSGSSETSKISVFCNTIGSQITEGLKSMLKFVLFTSLEFFPWVFGSILIYYSYVNYGLAISLAVFVFMMSLHGIMRWIRTQNNYATGSGCFQKPVTPQPPRRNAQNHDSSNENADGESEDDSDDDSDSDTDSEPETPKVIEPPPSYDTISEEPEGSPKHLICHLTPTITRQVYDEPQVHIEEKPTSSNFLTVPTVSFGRRGSGGSLTPVTTDDEDNDFFLPSYFDAVRRASLAAESETEDSCYGSEYKINVEEDGNN